MALFGASGGDGFDGTVIVYVHVHVYVNVDGGIAGPFDLTPASLTVLVNVNVNVNVNVRYFFTSNSLVCTLAPLSRISTLDTWNSVTAGPLTEMFCVVSSTV